MKRSLLFFLLLAFLGTPALAHAELSKKVIAAFKGKIVVTAGDLPEGEDEAGTIAAIKKSQLEAVKGEKNADEVVSWTFRYTAFLSKAGPTSLTMAFFTNDKKKKYTADQRLDGIDPKSPVLAGEVTITADDGLTQGQSYLIKLMAESGGKQTVLAQTTLTVN